MAALAMASRATSSSSRDAGALAARPSHQQQQRGGLQVRKEGRQWWPAELEIGAHRRPRPGSRAPWPRPRPARASRTRSRTLAPACAPRRVPPCSGHGRAGVLSRVRPGRVHAQRGRPALARVLSRPLARPGELRRALAMAERACCLACVPSWPRGCTGSGTWLLALLRLVVEVRCDEAMMDVWMLLRNPSRSCRRWSAHAKCSMKCIHQKYEEEEYNEKHLPIAFATNPQSMIAISQHKGDQGNHHHHEWPRS